MSRHRIDPREWCSAIGTLPQQPKVVLLQVPDHLRKHVSVGACAPPASGRYFVVRLLLRVVRAEVAYEALQVMERALLAAHRARELRRHALWYDEQLLRFRG